MEKTLRGACIIGQSGGPTSVINSSAYGVIRTALDSDCITKVYGAAHGIKGEMCIRDRYDFDQVLVCYSVSNFSTDANIFLLGL